MQAYDEIGTVLLRAREEHMLTVGDVAKALHIRPRYIEALEGGDMETMPNAAYAKGYLRRYAVYLSLDQEEILRRFDAISKEQSSSFFMPHSFSSEKRAHPQTAAMSGLFLFLLFLVWGLWIRPAHEELSLVEKVPEKIMEEPEKNVAESKQNPCLQAAIGVYPPCYWPLPEPPKSVMFAIKP